MGTGCPRDRRSLGVKVALVYDWLSKIGGAEQVLVAFHELYPDADWYTSVWDPRLAPFSRTWRVYPSFLNRLFFIRSRHELVPYLMPFAFESLDLSGYDVVISVGSAESKGIITRPETLHINYCLTPTRYLWSHRAGYQRSAQFGLVKIVFRPLIDKILDNLSKWDLVAATRPDTMISISEHVKNRVQKYYKRSTEVIYPPVDTQKFMFPAASNNPQSSSYYLVVSRLVPYKNIDLLVRVFKDWNKELVIVGTGSEYTRLKKLIGNAHNIKLLGHVSSARLLDLYHGCRAFLHAGEEDFGIAIAEAQAAGKPVIASSQGGAGEIVKHGVTGILVSQSSVLGFRNAIDKSETIAWSREKCSQNASKFDKVIWSKLMQERIKTLWETKKT